MKLFEARQKSARHKNCVRLIETRWFGLHTADVYTFWNLIHSPGASKPHVKFTNLEGRGFRLPVYHIPSPWYA